MRRRTIILLAALPLAVAATLGGVLPALAQGGIPAPATSSPNPTPTGLVVGDGYVVVDPDSAVQSGSSTFYPTGPISPDTLVVIPDASGGLPGGLTPEQFSAALAELHAEGVKAATVQDLINALNSK